MGYTTYFSGSVTIDPPLNTGEIAFLKKFNETRRMQRANGPYFVDGSGFAGQGSDPDIENFNAPPDGQPGLWCHWMPTDDGAEIVWDDGEKFYEAAAWMKYIITHFLQPDALAKKQLPFLQANHTVNGTIEAQGEESEDRWDLIVKDNKVFVQEMRFAPVGDPEEV
jgi:hypothetical protein